MVRAHLLAMTTVLFLATFPATAQQPVAAVRIESGGKLLALYKHEQVPFKPYIRELYTPAGLNVLLDAPPDHLHHHGLMFAIAADGVDFWAETPKCGKQVTRSIDAKDGVISTQLDWNNSDGQTLVLERRAIAPQKLDGVTLMTWTTELSLPPGKTQAKLTGSHYFGMGMRFPRSMDKAARFLLGQEDPKADPVRGDEQVRPMPWVAAQGVIDGKPVTVALFDSPKNPRHPNRVFTMTDPFSYQSLTLNLWKEPMILDAGKSLSLKYGVAAWDGHVDKAAVQKTYDQWLKL
ncbi:MAG: DUF6807 family protein [Tepidisphaerales bacterium]